MTDNGNATLFYIYVVATFVNFLMLLFTGNQFFVLFFTICYIAAYILRQR